MPTGQKAKSYKENMEYKRANSWKAKLKYNVDRAIWSSVSFDEFLMKMTESGYEIRKRNYRPFMLRSKNILLMSKHQAPIMLMTVS